MAELYCQKEVKVTSAAAAVNTPTEIFHSPIYLLSEFKNADPMRIRAKLK